MRGILTQLVQWIEHPTFSEGTPTEWIAGLVLVIMAGFLWSTVVKQTVESI